MFSLIFQQVYMPSINFVFNILYCAMALHDCCVYVIIICIDLLDSLLGSFFSWFWMFLLKHLCDTFLVLPQCCRLLVSLLSLRIALLFISSVIYCLPSFIYLFCICNQLMFIIVELVSPRFTSFTTVLVPSTTSVPLGLSLTLARVAPPFPPTPVLALRVISGTPLTSPWLSSALAAMLSELCLRVELPSVINRIAV